MDLALACVFEISWALGLKYSAGFTRFWPSVGTLVGVIGAYVFLTRAVREIPLGTAYAIWTGVGAAGTALLGMWLFDESRAVLRLVSLGLIVTGVVGLKVAEGR